MSRNGKCVECQAIAYELLEAYAEAWDSADQALRAAWTDTYRMIGGTEADAERAEQLIPTVQNRNAARINRVLQRMYAHEAVSGHRARAAFER